MSKKKKAKKWLMPILIGTAAVCLLLFIIISSLAGVIGGVISSLAGDDTSGGVTAAIEHTIMRSLDRFKISGTKEDGYYNLIFSFTEWNYTMTGIVLEDTDVEQEITVRLPAVSGTRDEMAYSFLLRNGFTSEAACGVLGNIDHQTGGTFDASKDNFWQGTYGIFGWSDKVDDTDATSLPRKTPLFDYLEELEISTTEDSDELFLTQLKYALAETNYFAVISSVKYMKNESEAAKTFCKDYIRPVLWATFQNKASDRAKEYYQKFKGRRGYVDTGVYDEVELRLTLVKDGDKIYFDGWLDGVNIGGYFKDEEAVVGRGTFGEGAYSKASIMLNPFGENIFQITSLAMVDRWDPVHPENGIVLHTGWDLYAYHKAPIYSVYDGTVVFAGYDYYRGNDYVVIDCGELFVHYCHMDSRTVEVGEVVSAGQQVGTQGASGYVTGSHLHLEFTRGNRYGQTTANLEEIEDVLIEYSTNYNTMQQYFYQIKR